MPFRIRRIEAVTAMFAFILVATPSWAKKSFVPNDTLTDYNVTPADRPEDVAILRAMQKTHDPQGKPMRRVPAIGIFSLRHENAKGPLPPLPSQHLRLKPGLYRMVYACSYKNGQMESFQDLSLAAGRRYFIYCESKNSRHYELKVTEVP